jgi:phage tail sheath gpL-like
MTLRISTALRNHVLSGGSLKDTLNGGKILIYSGAQPATADAAPTGTLLATITANSLAHTAEVQATGTITLSGSAGSVDGVTVDGVSIIDTAVPFDTSLAVTAANLAAAINSSASNPEYTASAAGAVVTIKAKRGAGSTANGLVIAATLTTLTATYAALSGGVSAANGLKFGSAAAGVLPKLPAQVWSGAAVATGTAGWFRFVGAVADSGALDAAENEIRLDGSISTSGAQLNMSSTTVTASATQTIASFPITLPTS